MGTKPTGSQPLSSTLPTGDDLSPDFDLADIANIVQAWRDQNIGRAKVPMHIRAFDYMLDALLEYVSREGANELDGRVLEMEAANCAKAISRLQQAKKFARWKEQPNTQGARDAQAIFYSLYGSKRQASTKQPEEATP